MLNNEYAIFKIVEYERSARDRRIERLRLEGQFEPKLPAGTIRGRSLLPPIGKFLSLIRK
jgi:hypothetical protein